MTEIDYGKLAERSLRVTLLGVVPTDDPHVIADMQDVITRLLGEKEAVVTHMRKMSDALLKVRPLGGSELFVAVGTDYFAAPEFCGQAIDQLRNDLHVYRRALTAERAENKRLREALVEARRLLWQFTSACLHARATIDKTAGAQL